jgi:ABC-type metal ion transport system substrate-binding protein
MKRLSAIVLNTLVAFSITACSSHKAESEVIAKAEPIKAAVETQDIRVMTVANPDGKITGATIEDAFTANGFVVDGNNDMNKPFSLRFGKTWYKTYSTKYVYLVFK